jgi:hypothetical protein
MIYSSKFLFLLFFVSLQALLVSSPDWVVKENDYQYTMTLVTKLNIDGKQLVGAEDKVGAFVGGICRGVSGLTYVASKKSYYAYLTIFSNKQGEVINFKLYHQASNTIKDVAQPLIFVINEHKGSLSQSYSIAEPALNNQAELNTFSLKEIPSISSTIRAGEVKISISENFPLTNLVPLFTSSKGAQVFEKGLLQISGETTKDFSSVLTYEVLSEDESVLQTYKVYISPVSNTTLFYKKDAVCTARGAIKVVSKQEGSLVQLTSDGKEVARVPIVNGQAIFPELGVGTYEAILGNEQKSIRIQLKEK